MEKRVHDARRRSILVGIGLVVIVVVAALALILWPDDSVEFGPPIVLEDEMAPATDIVPASGEIERAQQRLGSGGFLGLIACNTSSQYHATLVREMADFARAYGLEVRVYDPDSDVYEQVTLMEKARAEGAQGLIVCPLDLELMDVPLTDAKEAGIPMVVMHGDMPNYGGVRMMV